MKHKKRNLERTVSDREGRFVHRIDADTVFHSMTPMVMLMTGRLGDRDILYLPLGSIHRKIRKTLLKLNSLPYVKSVGTPSLEELVLEADGPRGKSFLSKIERLAFITEGVSVKKTENTLTITCRGDSKEYFWNVLEDEIIGPSYSEEKEGSAP